jgi:hypothetical protein
MHDSEYILSPAEIIVSSFWSGQKNVVPLDAGLKALVEATAFDLAQIYLISKNALVELSHQYSKESQSSSFEPRASSLPGGMAIVLSCPGPRVVVEIDSDSDSSDEWYDYFDLAGRQFARHAIIFLIAPMGYNFGFLCLQGNSDASLTEGQRQMLINVAHAAVAVIDYERLADKFTAKRDECAAKENELAALKDTLGQ